MMNVQDFNTKLNSGQQRLLLELAGASTNSVVSNAGEMQLLFNGCEVDIPKFMRSVKGLLVSNDPAYPVLGELHEVGARPSRERVVVNEGVEAAWEGGLYDVVQVAGKMEAIIVTVSGYFRQVPLSSIKLADVPDDSWKLQDMLDFT